MDGFVFCKSKQKAHRLKSVLLVVEPVFHLNGKLAGIVEMCSAKCVAFVFQIAGVAQIESSRRKRPLLAERLANRNVCFGVWSEVRRAVSVEESRAERNAGGNIRVPGQGNIESSVQRVPLVVVQ